MAQKIKHRRGSVATVRSIPAFSEGEVIIGSGSIDDKVVGPIVYIGKPGGTTSANDYTPVSKLYAGSGIPSITPAVFGTTADGLPYYDTNGKKLYILGAHSDGTSGHTAITLTSQSIDNFNTVVSASAAIAGFGGAVAVAGTVSGSVQIDHDSTTNFVANEHIDWTSDQGGTNIHSGNYTDTNTTYSVGDGGLSQINFTSADNTKLDGIEASADVTDATNVVAALDTLGVISGSAQLPSGIISGSAQLPSGTVSGSAQIDIHNTTGYVANEHLDWTSNVGTIHSGNYTDTTTNTQLSQEQVEDFVGGMLGGTETGITVTYQDSTGDIDFVVATQTANDFTNTLKTKLDAIEASADVTDATNVVAALTAGTNIAIAGDGTISSTDTNTTYSVTDGQLSQINFTSADNTKLDGIEASADVTDAANVLSSLIGTELVVKSITAETYVVSSSVTHLTTSFSSGSTIFGDDILDTHQFTGSLYVSGSLYGDGSNLTGVGGTAGTVSGSIQVSHDDTTGFVANEHIDWTSDQGGTNIHSGNYTDTTTNTQLSQEQVEDFVGGMLGGTETGISVTYQDSTGDIDFVVATQTANDFTNTLKTKLDAIEASADVTDVTNVLANLPAGIISGSIQLPSGIISGSAQLPAGTVSGSAQIDIHNTTGYVANEHLDWTSDQGGTNIHSGNYTDTNTTYSVGDGGLSQINFTSADNTKLDGIEASADVTDSTNVLASLPAGIISGSTQLPSGIISGSAQLPSGIISGSVQVSHDDTTGFVANEHLDWTSNVGTIHSGNYTDTTTNTQLSAEQVEDFVGAMLGGTETGITVTYQDSTGDIDFVVATQTANDFTNTLKSKLDAIEASADVTDTTNVVANLPSGVISGSAQLPAGISIPAGTVSGSIQVSHDDTTGFVANEHIDWTADGAGTLHASTYTDTTTNTQLSQEQVEDFAGAMVASGGTKTGITITYQDSTGDMDFVVATQTANDFTNTLKTKLDAIEASADVTDATNVIAALDTLGVISGSAQLPSGTVSGSAQIDHDSTTNFVANEHIDWTSDQGGTNIHSGNYTDTNTTYAVQDGQLSQINFTSADNTKLDGIEASADVTDTTNVLSSLIGTELVVKTITAEEYVVSSSVTHMTTSFSSGSTIFGDTPLDTHQFTGSLYVSSSVTAVSFIGDGSLLTSVPAPTGTISGSAQLPSGIISGSAQLPSGTVSGSAQIDHDSTANFVANEHLDWTSNVGTIHSGNYTDTTTNTQLSAEQVEDFVGGMLGGTETGITVTYQDSTGDIDFVVATQTANDFTNTLKTKLDAIEASADVTDVTNVTSAGALMDSELTSIANVKALDQSLVSGATPTFTTTNFTDASDKRLMTNAQETKLDSVESSADVTDAANVLTSLPAGVVSGSTFPLGVNITGSTSIYRSGSVGDTTVFSIDGGLGNLFTVTDELTGSLFSVNDVSGIPLFEVFSYETIKMGTFGAEALLISGSDVQTSGSLAVGAIANSATNGRIDASNDVVAFSTSDRRWKDNIKVIESPLQKLLKLGGYEFDWREDTVVHGNKGHDVGVIAQEVEAVLPEAVQTRSSGMKAVRYEKLIPLLIETIKEQQTQIDELKNRIK